MYIDEVGTYACHMYGMFGIFLNKIYSKLASNEVCFFDASKLWRENPNRKLSTYLVPVF